jgi:hypothetical protein
VGNSSAEACTAVFPDIQDETLETLLLVMRPQTAIRTMTALAVEDVGAVDVVVGVPVVHETDQRLRAHLGDSLSLCTPRPLSSTTKPNSLRSLLARRRRTAWSNPRLTPTSAEWKPPYHQCLLQEPRGPTRLRVAKAVVH